MHKNMFEPYIKISNLIDTRKHLHAAEINYHSFQRFVKTKKKRMQYNLIKKMPKVAGQIR